jgi:PIN domain
MGTSTLLVDYENVQNIDMSLIQEKDIQIKIFVGQSQNQLPFELIQSTQRLGSALEWIKIEGNGANSLDFHIAFCLGQLSEKNSNFLFIILSKDKGFDPLIRYLGKKNITCRRIESLLELSQEKDKIISHDENMTAKVLEKLSKIEKNKRPKNRNALRQLIKSLLSQKKLSEQELDMLIDILFIQKKVSEVS